MRIRNRPGVNIRGLYAIDAVSSTGSSLPPSEEQGEVSSKPVAASELPKFIEGGRGDVEDKKYDPSSKFQVINCYIAIPGTKKTSSSSHQGFAKGRILQAEQYEEAATGPDMKVYRGRGKVDDALLEGSDNSEEKHKRSRLNRNIENQNLVHDSEEENEMPVVHWCRKLKRTQSNDAKSEEVDKAIK